MSDKRLHLSLDPKESFPEKLYDVANDGALVKWNRNGSVSVSDEVDFENSVMKMYPGFLQIPSFLNFRRLFREYGFDWALTQDGTLEFSHPSFVRGRRALLSEIKTRRKAFSAPSRIRHEPVVIETDPNRRYSTRKRKRTVRYRADEEPSESSSRETCEEENGAINRPAGVQIQNIPRKELSSVQHDPRRTDIDLSDVQESYAKNEFNEDEYLQWVVKKRKLDTNSSESEVRDEIDIAFKWLYYGDDGSPPSTVDDHQDHFKLTPLSFVVNKTTDAACGFCNCCLSMNESALYYDTGNAVIRKLDSH